MFIRVVLPEPLGPTMATNSPDWIPKVTLSRAFTVVGPIR